MADRGAHTAEQPADKCVWVPHVYSQASTSSLSSSRLMVIVDDIRGIFHYSSPKSHSLGLKCEWREVLYSIQQSVCLPKADPCQCRRRLMADS